LSVGNCGVKITVIFSIKIILTPTIAKISPVLGIVTIAAPFPTSRLLSPAISVLTICSACFQYYNQVSFLLLNRRFQLLVRQTD